MAVISNQPLQSCREQACEAAEQSEHELFVVCLQADPKGPSFQTVFCNTEQMLKVDQDSKPTWGSYSYITVDCFPHLL